MEVMLLFEREKTNDFENTVYRSISFLNSDMFNVKKKRDPNKFNF